MTEYPSLTTERLFLRKFETEDAMVVRTLAGAYEIAHGCLSIPHPYECGMAETWIACHSEWFREGTQVVFAITRKEDRWILGAIGIMIEQDHYRAEIGYWIGVPFWGQGYATEAAQAVVRFAFDDLHMKRVTASYFQRNPASARVIEKLGMKREGLLRKHILKEGTFEDLIFCGILDTEWRGTPFFNDNQEGEMDQ